MTYSLLSDQLEGPAIKKMIHFYWGIAGWGNIQGKAATTMEEH